MKWRWFVAVALFLALDALLGVWLWRRWREHRFDPLIQAASVKYQVAPSLIKAVIWQESRFDPGVRGRAGEFGLMQIREMAAREWADAEGLEEFKPDHLTHPQTNTLAGTYYLAKLLKRYLHTDDPVPYALADYNAGRSNVLKWNQGEGSTNSQAFVEQIGFPGTRAYVRSVIARAATYEKRPGRPRQ